MRAGVGGAGRDVEGGGWPGGDWCRRLTQLYVMETKRKAKTDRGDKLHSVDACMHVCVCVYASAFDQTTCQAACECL